MQVQHLFSFRKILKIALALAIISFVTYSCTSDLIEDTQVIEHNEVEVTSHFNKEIDLEKEPEIRKLIGILNSNSISGGYELPIGLSEVLTDEIVSVTDDISGETKFTFRVSHSENRPGTFYNLMVQKKRNGKVKEAFVV